LWLSFITILPRIHKGSYGNAELLFYRMRDSKEQGRDRCIWNDVLARVALDRCTAMAQGGWWGHFDPQGHGPNWWVRQAGYDLPGFYLDEANNIESIGAGGTGQLDQMWDAWMRSPGHRGHILGEYDFFAEQENIGYQWSSSCLRRNGRYGHAHAR
jgi:hypothetical protein